MEKLLIVTVSIVLIALVALFVMGRLSQSGSAPGLIDGRLATCPGTPNCVSSESAVASAHYIEPLAITGADPVQVMAKLKRAILDAGGSVQLEKPGYLGAIFASSVFRFVDDLEARLDMEHRVIHLRSASRVGRSDLDANRKRVERLKRSFYAQPG